MRRAVAAGKRVYLRKPAVADGAEFVERTVASRHHLQPFVYAAEDDGAYRQWLTRGTRPEIEQFLVCARDDDTIVGFVNLNNIVRGSLQQAFAGWAGFLPRIGQGLLTEGLDLTLELAFTQLRLHRVEANIQPANHRSRALALRCGLVLEGFSPKYLQVGGEWRDHERWAIREDQWRTGRRPRPAPG